jgi:putative transposase
MGFVIVILENKRRFRAFNVIDDYNKEKLPVEIDLPLTSNRIVWVLNQLINRKGKPKQIRIDNSPEFIAHNANDWSKMQEIEFKYIQAVKPRQNAFVERFNRSYKRGVLDKYIFENIDQVRKQTLLWMYDDNNHRPSDSLSKFPPIAYAQKHYATGFILK